MKLRRSAFTMVLASAGFLASPPADLSGQRGPPAPQTEPGYFAVGLSAGGSATDNKRLFDRWDFGPVFGARLEWFRGRSSWLLYADVQPFRALRSNIDGDYRAYYILPAYVLGTPESRIGIAAGVGVFDFTLEGQDDGRETAFVPSLFASRQILNTLSVEFGWKRIANVRGLRVDLYTLQLVQQLRF